MNLKFFVKNLLIREVAKYNSIHRCVNLIQIWICKISVRFEIKRGRDSIAVHLLQIEKSKGKKRRLTVWFCHFVNLSLYFFIKSCSNDVLVVFASVSFLSYSIPHRKFPLDNIVMRIARELVAFNISISCPGNPLVISPFSYKFFFRRFSANSTKYRGYAYSYNPCSAFHLGPPESGCQENVAVSH